MNEAQVCIERTRQWVEKAVVGLQLCPFAAGVHHQGLIRYQVSAHSDIQGLLQDLEEALLELQQTSAQTVDTVLLIHPHVLQDFQQYNDFLDQADALIQVMDLEGEVQVASFHPQYQFAGTAVDDIENYTNRSPYPMLHLLREASVTRAVEAMPDPDEVSRRNIRTLRQLGHAGWDALWES